MGLQTILGLARPCHAWTFAQYFVDVDNLTHSKSPCIDIFIVYSANCFHMTYLKLVA